MLTPAQFRQIVDLCAPHMQTSSARMSAFNLAFADAPFRNSINWEGATNEFVPHLLRVLLKVHRYNDQHPLRALLMWLKTQYGADIHPLIDSLLPPVDALPPEAQLPDLPLTLFLSYARADDEMFVRLLYNDLTARGFNVWYDRANMPNRGLGFTQEIARAIEQADRLLLVCGPRAYESEYVRMEWQHALAHCKPIIPVVRLGDFPPPILAQLSPEPLDALDMRDHNHYSERLAHLVRTLLDGSSTNPCDFNRPLSEALLNASYDDLNEVMQRRFRLLGVFAPDSSFEVNAAAVVWEEPTEIAQQKLNFLERLTLVERDVHERYSQTNALCVYAHHLACQYNELDAAAERHALYYCEQVRAASDNQTFYAVQLDLPQLRTAFTWAIHAHRVDLAQRIFDSTIKLFQSLKLNEECLSWAMRLAFLTEAVGGDLGSVLALRGDAFYAAADNVAGEIRQSRLLQALSDYTSAIELQRNIPLTYAQMLNKRADLLRQIAELPGENRRSRLSQALQEAWQASQIFSEHQYATHYEASQNLLKAMKRECGSEFESLWMEAVGQPQPEWLHSSGQRQPQSIVTPQTLDDSLLGALVSALPVGVISADEEAYLEQLVTEAPAGPVRDALLHKLSEARRRRSEALIERRLHEWIQTSSWDESRAYLEEHRAELLTDEAESVLQRIATERNRREYSQHLDLLAQSTA